ncbi:MAG: hypothetical protein D6724_02435 [Armatimonadetes bacterium]|nr:MAG: hypothetical protein D6724_02435 [Armatimonadota bacterium]
MIVFALTLIHLSPQGPLPGLKAEEVRQLTAPPMVAALGKLAEDARIGDMALISDDGHFLFDRAPRFSRYTLSSGYRTYFDVPWVAVMNDEVRLYTTSQSAHAPLPWRYEMQIADGSFLAAKDALTLLFFGRPPHARDVVGVFHLDERGENPNEAARIPRYDGLFIPLAGALQSSRGRDWATVYGVIMPPTRNAPARVEAYELVGRNVRNRLGKFGDVEVSWTGWVPMAFDPTRSRLLVIYDTAGSYLHEFELLTRTWTHHSKPPASLIRPFYFRGHLYANLKDASRAWLVTTTGGDNWKEVGDYTVVAKSSSERFLIVERNADKTYWLLRFE